MRGNASEQNARTARGGCEAAASPPPGCCGACGTCGCGCEIAVGKTSNESKQDFVIAVGGLATKYGINYGTIADPCWGPEGFSTIKGYPYFRVGTFELYAWLVP